MKIFKFFIIFVLAFSVNGHTCVKKNLITSLEVIWSETSEILNYTPLGDSCLLASTPLSRLFPFWAQAQTGALLVALDQNNPIYHPHEVAALIRAIDTSREGNHGGLVTNLMASGALSAPIRLLKQEMNFYDQSQNSLNEYERFIDYLGIEWALRECITLENCPHYINHSAGWLNSDEMRLQVQEFNRQTGGFFVVASGNHGGQTENAQIQAVQDQTVLLVGSSSPEGMISGFTSLGPEQIFAPSDASLRSYAQGRYQQFGGTSGASPQVTAALGLFSLITGQRLSRNQAYDLLQITSTDQVDQVSRERFPLLNTWRIYQLAHHIKNRCELGNTVCWNEALSRHGLRAALEELNQSTTAPVIRERSCLPEPAPNLTTCREDQEDYLNYLRYALIQSSPDHFLALSCLMARYGHVVDSQLWLAKARAPSDFQNLDIPYRLDLATTNLARANFSRARFYGTSLAGRNLVESRFHHADLRGVDFRHAQLRGAEFDHADLRGADFSQVPVAVLRRLQFHQTIYDRSTKFPSGFTPRSPNFIRRRR
jgi:hypothetical protein